MVSTATHKTQNWIEISQSNVTNNLEVFLGLSKFVFPVIKSNAYSHGIKEIVTILDKTDCTMLVVDSFFEAIEAMEFSQKPILILGYTYFESITDLYYEQLSYAVDSVDALLTLEKLSKPIKVHIEINTGMNRCGFDIAQIEDILVALRLCQNIVVEGIFSHLADSDWSDNGFTEIQTRRFDQVMEKFLENNIKPKYVHLGQSAGSTKVVSKYANGIRPGIGIYGFNPLSPSDANFAKLKSLELVLSLKSTIVKIIPIKAGKPVGYNCTFVASRDTRIGLIPFGYYEGLPRSLSNQGYISVLVNGQKQFLPIVGRVCMNFTMINLFDFEVKLGETIEIISDQNDDPNSVTNIAKIANTIPWEVLTNLKANIARRVVA
jgi:alanine racemase